MFIRSELFTSKLDIRLSEELSNFLRNVRSTGNFASEEAHSTNQNNYFVTYTRTRTTRTPCSRLNISPLE